MPKAEERAAGLVEDLDLLIRDISDQWGFEMRLAASDVVKPGKTLRSVRFAEAMIVADGMDPAKEANWMRRIKRRFQARYGDALTPEEYARAMKGG